MQQEFGRAVSLGPLCTSKFQARRILAARQRLSVNPKGRTIVPGSPNAVFDWQVTPVDALMEYLRREFVGMFDRDDLSVVKGAVANLRYGTSHPHEFPTGSGLHDVASYYALARSRHDHLVARAIAFLRDDVPTLFLYSRPIAAEERQELLHLLQRYNCKKRIEILVVGDQSRDWTGNDGLWDSALAHFSIAPVQETAQSQRKGVEASGFLAAQIVRFRRHLARMKF